MRQKSRLIYKLCLFVFIFFQAGYLFFVKTPQIIDSGNLYTASDTLSNSRLSYYGRVSGAHTAGVTAISIKTSRTSYLPPDINVNHLFSLDEISVGPNGYCNTSGTTKCKVSETQTSANTFTLVKGLRVGASDSDPIYATQSAIHSLVFTTQTSVINGNVRVYVPAGGSSSATSQDGAPDGGANSGFDLNGLTTAVSRSLCPTEGGVSWTSTTPTITAYQLVGSTYYHQFDCAYTGTLTTTALTMTIGNSTAKMVNPAAKVNGTYTHAQGTADTYNVRILLQDGSSNTIDDVIVTVSPIEAVLISATVNPSLTFTIAGQNTGTPCNQTLDVTTATAYSIPYGDITTTNAFLDAAQKLTISTNGPNGYIISVAEDDEMSGDLNGDGTPDTALADTTCDDSLCTHSTSDDWDSTTTAGWGYSIEDINAASHPFQHWYTSGNCTGGTYCARNFACVDGLNPANAAACGTNDSSAQAVASSSAVASSEQFYMCYRLNVSATQQAGYYQTRLYYIATGRF